MVYKPGSVRRNWRDGHSSGTEVTFAPQATYPNIGENHPLPYGNMFLSGLAPGGVYPANPVAGIAVRSYRTVSPLPSYDGGLFSVALSLRSPSPDVIRHRDFQEPGLSSA